MWYTKCTAWQLLNKMGYKQIMQDILLVGRG